jgi:hypothetical protein
MALHNEILEGRFSKYLTKIFSMKGGAPAPQISSEYQANLQFFTGVEDRALQGWYRYGLLFSQVAGVGQAAARLRNPPNSNRLVVIERVLMCDNGTGAVAKNWSLETQTTVADNSGPFAIAANSSWDKRLNLASPLIGSVSNGAAGLSLIRALVAMPAAGGNFEFITEEQQEIILSPGEAIQVRATVNATDVNASFWWRERNFADSEATA